ncbi:MAG TPA: hypothetical protein VM286_06115 [Candidatus Thermoplasmatota archaeon]|nr:hypothetical protein [Candidatus Thermoplasmatota archaeon]
MAKQRRRLFQRTAPDEAASQVKEALRLVSQAAEAGRRIGLFGAKVAMQSGNDAIFHESAEEGMRCGEWSLELAELPSMKAPGPEVLEMCAVALRDIAKSYAAAARAIKVTEAVRGTQLAV